MPGDRSQLDTTYQIVTPENIAFSYRVAGPFRRMPAFLIDMVLKVVIIGSLWVGGMMLIGLLGLSSVLMQSYTALMLVFVFVMNWFYGGVFETLWNGQTPGKWLLSIRVLSVNGKPINGLQAIFRNLLREVEIAFPLAGLVMMAGNSRFQRLGDWLADTMVVVEDRQWLTGIAKLEDPRTASLANYIPADFMVSRTMAKAVAAYVERRRFFTPLRRREIARHLAEPLLAQFGMPADTSHDLLMCAIYHRAFIADVGEEVTPVPGENSPFAIANSPTSAKPSFEFLMK